MSEEKDLTLVVLSFDGDETAKAALKKVKELKKEKKVTIEDMVAVNKNEKGKVKLTQGRGFTGKKGALGFGAVGLIGAAIVAAPVVIPAAIGAGIGAASSQVKKIFDNDELKKLGEDLGPDESLLFMVLSDFVPGSMESAMDEVGAKMNAFLLAEEGLVAMGAVSEDESFLAVMTEDVILVEEAVLIEDEDEDEDGKTCSTDETCKTDGTCCATEEGEEKTEDAPEKTEETKEEMKA